jgi:Protein of unknown function (DUF2917)
MQAVFEQLEFRLGARDVVSVRRAAAAAITVLTGSVWVTQEGNARDHVLLRGQTLRVEGNAALMVAALAPAQVSISAARQARPNAARWRRSIAAWYLRRSRRLRAAHSPLGGVL